MSDVYSQFGPPPASNYFKFENPGDEIAGVITAVRRKEEDENGAACPVWDLRLADGSETSIFISNVNLYRQVYALQPTVGDEVYVQFVRKDGRVKIYNLRARRNGVELAEGAAPAATAPTPNVPAPAPAPWGAGGTAPAPTAPAAPAPWGSAPAA